MKKSLNSQVCAVLHILSFRKTYTVKQLFRYFYSLKQIRKMIQRNENYKEIVRQEVDIMK